jgi:hypothetical protein
MTGLSPSIWELPLPARFVGLISGSGLFDYFWFVRHERMLCAGEARKKKR